MIEFTEWFNNARNNFTKKWAILGKGPTLSAYSSFTNDFHAIGLNHVVQNHAVDILHAIDLEVIIDCQDILDKQCHYVFMPFIPNIGFRSGGMALNKFFDSIPILKKLSNENRLIWYCLRIGKETRSHPTISSPPIEVRYFSSEAALGLLGNMGIRDVRSFGIDGGNTYAKEFDHLKTKTLLSNGRISFDVQFGKLDAIATRFSINYHPMTKPMRVYIGADEPQSIAAKVLEYSILKHASKPVQVTHTPKIMWPKDSNKPKNSSGTISLSRFAVPELSSFSGRAMYCDADMLAFGDISSLWDFCFGSHTILCTSQHKTADKSKHDQTFIPWFEKGMVMLDCQRLNWRVQDIIHRLSNSRLNNKITPENLILEPEENVGDKLPSSWYSVDCYEIDSTNLLHYKNKENQPWKYTTNQYRFLWIREFKNAIRDGAISIEEVAASARKGYVDSSLIEVASDPNLQRKKPPAKSPLYQCQQQLLKSIQELRQVEHELAIAKRESSRGVIKTLFRKMKQPFS